MTGRRAPVIQLEHDGVALVAGFLVACTAPLARSCGMNASVAEAALCSVSIWILRGRRKVSKVPRAVAFVDRIAMTFTQTGQTPSVMTTVWQASEFHHGGHSAGCDSAQGTI